MTAASKKGITDCTAFVRKIRRDFMDKRGHDFTTLSKLQIQSATPGRVIASMDVSEHNLNRMGTAHGGLLCTLVDTMGSLAVATKGYHMTGVSTDIHTTFCAPAPLGTTLLVDGELISIGKYLARTRININLPAADGKPQRLVAFGSHTKYIKDILDNPKNKQFDSEGRLLNADGSLASEGLEDVE